MASSLTHSSASFDVNMAEVKSPALNAKILRPLDEALRCHICFDYFTSCMITKCSHNYCSVCIRRYMTYKSQCPTCFQVATEPELQNNRLIDEILRIYKNIRETLQIPLDSIEKPFPEQPGSSRADRKKEFTKPPKCDTSYAATSDKAPIKTEERNSSNEVACPVCYITVSSDRINGHLDTCLKQSDERNQRKLLPKLVYHLLTDKQIRKILKDHGLSTSGDRQTLIKRHKNFLILYNANCDSLNPKPVSDLLLEVERQELEERLNAHQRNVQVNKKSEPSVIEREHETYVREHQAQFQSLINDVQQRDLGRVHIKKECAIAEDVSSSQIVDESGNVIGESSLRVGSPNLDEHRLKMATATTSSTESSSKSLVLMPSCKQIQNTSSESSRSRNPVVRHNRPHAYARISSDKKDILIKCYEEDKTISESAQIAGINRNTAKYIINQYNKNDGVLIKKQWGGRRNVKLSEVILSKIEKIIQENPSVTLRSIREKILESEHVALSLSSVRNGLQHYYRNGLKH